MFSSISNDTFIAILIWLGFIFANYCKVHAYRNPDMLRSWLVALFVMPAVRKPPTFAKELLMLVGMVIFIMVLQNLGWNHTAMALVVNTIFAVTEALIVNYDIGDYATEMQCGYQEAQYGKRKGKAQRQQSDTSY